MAQEEFERNQEMWRLRHIEGWTNTAIGKKQNPPISRERVRQIIGNTGRFFRREWTEKMKSMGKYTPDHIDDVENLPGVKRVWLEDWGKNRHIARSGYVRLSQEFEDYASQILIGNGISHTVMSSRHPYSIETDSGIRIDVRVGRRNVANMKSQNKCVYPTFVVPNVSPEDYYDFLMAFIPDGYGFTYFVIPQSELSHLSYKTSQLRIPWPPESGKPSKWHKYHERIDFILES